MNKTLLQLNICQNAKSGNTLVTNGQERIEEYVNGIDELFEYCFVDKADVLLCDNSTKDLDKRIVKALPFNCEYVLYEDNRGDVNKGAGLLHQWNKCAKIMERYEWILYFEPRQLLQDFKFFDSFFNNPRNLFNVRKNHFWTGILSIESKLLRAFIENRLLAQYESLEFTLFNYMKAYNYDHEEVNLLWHDVTSGKWCKLNEI